MSRGRRDVQPQPCGGTLGCGPSAHGALTATATAFHGPECVLPGWKPRSRTAPSASKQAVLHAQHESRGPAPGAPLAGPHVPLQMMLWFRGQAPRPRPQGHSLLRSHTTLWGSSPPKRKLGRLLCPEPSSAARDPGLAQHPKSLKSLRQGASLQFLNIRLLKQ